MMDIHYILLQTNIEKELNTQDKRKKKDHLFDKREYSRQDKYDSSNKIRVWVFVSKWFAKI